jgi:hemerythrin-like metal-binding protein
MPLLTWDASLSVGLAEIDEQHSRFVALLNDLHDAMLAGRGRGAISEALEGLIAYMHEHFEAEERMMLMHRYPEYAQHRAWHEAFVARLVEWQERHERGEAVMTVEATSALRTWLVDHIKTMDRRYAPHFAAPAAR